MVVIGLALQETLGSLSLVGLSLQLDKPFEVGDFIRIGEHTGRVAQVNWRSIRIAAFPPGELVTAQLGGGRSSSRASAPRTATRWAWTRGMRASYDTAQHVMRAALLGCGARDSAGAGGPTPPIAHPLAFDESCVRYMVRFFVNDFSLADAA